MRARVATYGSDNHNSFDIDTDPETDPDSDPFIHGRVAGFRRHPGDCRQGLSPPSRRLPPRAFAAILATAAEG